MPDTPTIDSVADLVGRLRTLPRLGWVQSPTAVERATIFSRELGLELDIKRDDRCGPFFGSTKFRKLDYLLASAPWRDAARLESVGALGSGHLVACATAAESLGRRFVANLFDEPVAGEVEANLAHTASHSAELVWLGSRAGLVLKRPWLLSVRTRGDWAVIPPGGTCVAGTLGTLDGGLELGLQVALGECARPDVVVLPFGSGGTALGLAAALSLLGWPARVLAWSAVERPLVSRRRNAQLLTALAAALRPAGLQLDAQDALRRLEVRHGQVGPGYGVASRGSLAAVARAEHDGLGLEPIYGGKAMAGLIAAAPELHTSRVLFWKTNRGPLPPPSPDWRDRLPAAVRQRVEAADAAPRAVVRRRMFLAAGAATALGVCGYRGTGYPAPARQGVLLSARELAVLAATAEALFPAETAAGLIDAGDVALRVDAFLVGMPGATLQQIHGLFVLIEQGTFLDGTASRYTRLTGPERLEFLEHLAKRGVLMGQAVGGLRDLVLVGVWQQPAMWPQIGYAGPRVAAIYGPHQPHLAARRVLPSRYDALVARPGALPPGARA